MFKCSDCGRVFEYTSYRSDHVQENIYEAVDCCPHCRSDNYNEVVQCECCRDDFVDDSKMLPICDHCMEQLEKEIREFEGQTGLSRTVFCDFLQDWIERNW